LIVTAGGCGTRSIFAAKKHSGEACASPDGCVASHPLLLLFLCGLLCLFLGCHVSILPSI
jgi:hypothetical protein